MNVGPLRGAPRVATLREIVAEAQRETIRRALTTTGGNRTQAAKLLGIQRTYLHALMRKFKLGNAHGIVDDAPRS